MNGARQLVATLQNFSLPLIAGVIAGLAVANLHQDFYKDLVDYHPFGESAEIFGYSVTVHFLINEVFMVFFFGIAAKEITQSVLPGGVLNPIGKAINPLMGTLGGVIGPVSLYFLLTLVFYGGTDDFSEVANGWAIPTATDIALAWLVARLIFGQGHPAVNFLLLLAVADDAIGLGIIAIFYPHPEHPVEPVWLLMVVGGMAVAFAMRRMKVNSWVPYIVVGGALSWVGMIKAGIEPALDLVTIVPFLPGPKAETTMPAEGEGPGGDVSHATQFSAHAHTHSPLEDFEHHLGLIVTLGLFFFAFANAGVSFGNINPVTGIVLCSLIVGKTIGISSFSAAATMLGFPLPTGMGIRHLVVAGMIAGLGLTVALFVTGKAFTGPPFQDPAKMGAVFSIGVVIPAFIAGALLKVKQGIPRTPVHKSR